MEVIILDYSTVSAHLYEVDSEVFESYARHSAIEELIDVLGHKHDQCSWMFHNDSINIYRRGNYDVKVPMYRRR